jgi:predicted acyltransferase
MPVAELIETQAMPVVTSPAVPPPRERLLALDVFRGATIAGMLLVNDPGSWGSIYPPLEHAPWNGWTPTDLIFPFFLFIVGITTHLSLGTRRSSGAVQRDLVKKVIRRGLMIFLVGLCLNAFPFFWWGRIAGNADPTFLQRVAWRFEHLRFLGVLQRIGIVYLFAGLISLRATRNQIIGTAVAILLGYWIIMMLVPVPGTGTIGAFVQTQPERTLAAWTDRLILGTNHTWVQTKTWDPEGPLSTIPAIATALLGILAGQWITRKDKPLIERVAGLFGAGCLAMVAAELWHWQFPINKNLWTSSYVLFTAGFACVALATCLWLIDVNQVRGWTKPFAVYGLNPLVAFAGSGLMARTIDSLIKVNYQGKPTSLHEWSYRIAFQPFFADRFASLLWGLCFVAFWYGILWVLYKRNIIVKL